MITKFKIFENLVKAKCWLVKKDNYFNARLYMIGVPIDYMKHFDIPHIYKEVYVGNDVNGNFSYGYQKFPEEQYQYMGKVDLDNEGIENYEAALTAKKYNII